MSISATNPDISGNDSLTIRAFPGNARFGWRPGVNLTASSEFLSGSSQSSATAHTSGAWTVTAPTVQMDDGSKLDTTGDIYGSGNKGASLAIHTNNLNPGDNSNGSSTYIYGNGVTMTTIRRFQSSQRQA